MKKFLLNSLLLLFFISLAVSIILAVSGPFRNRWSLLSNLEASVDKETLLHRPRLPAIVFVGGSNCSFAINSRVVEQAFGRPVINMGLAAPLGLRFMLNEALNGLKNGDVAVLSLEYYLGEGNKHMLSRLYDVNPHAITFADRRPDETIGLATAYVQGSLRAVFYTFKRKVSALPLYRRNAFNEYGDIREELLQQADKVPLGRMERIVPVDYTRSIDMINNFADNARAKGVTVVLVFPAYSRFGFERDMIAITSLESKLKKELRCRVLGSSLQSVLKDKYFTDFPYHVDSEGRTEHTRMLIGLLAPEILSSSR